MLKQPQRGCLGKHILTVHDLLLCRDENYKCSPERLVKSLFAASEQSPPDLVQDTSSDSTIRRSEVLATKLNEVHGVEGKARVPYELWHALAAAYISPTDGRSDKKDLEEFLLSCIQMPSASTIEQVTETCRLSVERYKPNRAKNSSPGGTLSIKESCVFRVLDEANNELINLLVNVHYEVGRSKKSTTLQGPEDRIYRLEASNIEISLQNVGPISFPEKFSKANGTLSRFFNKKTQVSEGLRISCDDVGKFYVHVVPPKTNPSPGGAGIYKRSGGDNVNLSKFSLQMMKHDHIGRRVLAGAYNANSAITRILSAWACVGLNTVNLKWHKSSCEKAKYEKLTGYRIEGSWLFRVDGCLVYVDAEYAVFQNSTDSTLLLLKAFRAIVGEEKYDECFRKPTYNGVETRENIVYDASITKGNDPVRVIVPKLELYKSAEYQYARNTPSSTYVVTSAPISEIRGIISNARQSILTDTGINKDTLQAVVCCVTAWDTSHVGLIDHRVLHATHKPATATNNSALASSHVLGEHFTFYNRAECLYVYVCATYEVGNYTGNSAAVLSGLQVGVSEASDIVLPLDAGNIQGASLTQYSLGEYKAVCNCNKLREAVKSINVVEDTDNLLQAGGGKLMLYQDNDENAANSAMAMALGNVVRSYVSQIDRDAGGVQTVFENITKIVGNPFCKSSDVSALRDSLNDRVIFGQGHHNQDYGTCVFFDPVLVGSGSASVTDTPSPGDRVALLKGLRGLTEQANMNAAMLEAIVNILTPVKPPKIVYDMGAALQRKFLQETYSVQITDYVWSIRTDNPNRVSLIHDVLLAPRAWWKKTGSETGSVKVSIKFSMKTEHGDTSRKGYIVFDDVSVTVYGICDLAYLEKTLAGSAGAAPLLKSVYSKEIRTHGCCVSLLDVLESSYTLYNRSYRYMIQNLEMVSEPNASQNCLEEKIHGLVQEFVNLYGICDILKVPGMSLETRSDVLYHESPEENSARDLADLSKSHQMAISDTLFKSGIDKLSKYIKESLQGASVTNVKLDRTYSSLSDAADALMNDGIRVVQRYKIETAFNTRVSTFLDVTLCAKMSRRIGDRWVVAVTGIDLGVQPDIVSGSALGAGEYSGGFSGKAKQERSVLRLSSACIALLVKCEDIDAAAGRDTVATQTVAKTHAVVDMVTDTVAGQKRETVDTGSCGYSDGATGQLSMEKSCTAASESHSESSDKGCDVPLKEQLVADGSRSETFDEKCDTYEECRDVPALESSRLHAALYGALRGPACPDDKGIKKLLGVLVNVATGGKILCTDAYVGGRIPLRVSYKKLSDNELSVTYCMMAESGKYGVIEMELQYTVAREKNPNLAGGLVHKVKEGKFFIKGNNSDLVSESVHNIEKPVMISETKWHAFVDKHKKQLDLEHKKLGFWRRFVEFVERVCSTIVTFLCKICSYFSCIFCCFHRKTYKCEDHNAQVTCDNGIQGSYTAIDAANDTVRLTENDRDGSEAEVQSSCAQPIHGSSACDLSEDGSPATCVVDAVQEPAAPTPTARISLGGR